MKCAICETEFDKKTGNQKYCSPECRSRSRTETGLMVGDDLICDWCGCEFRMCNASQSSASKPYCCSGCRKDARTNSRNVADTGLCTLELIEIYIGQAYACIGCNRVMDYDVMESDHIVPVADDGGNGRWNIQRLCPSCNKSKGKRPMSEYMALTIPWRVEPTPQWRIIDAHRTAGAILLLDQYMRNCRLYHRARSIHYQRLPASTDGELRVIHQRPEWLNG